MGKPKRKKNLGISREPLWWRERLDLSRMEDLELFDKGGPATPAFGMGHFDRFYFTNCTDRDHVLGVAARIRCHDGQEHDLPDIGPLGPMMIGESRRPPEPSCKVTTVEVLALVEHRNDVKVYAYTCMLHPDKGEYISCVVAGIALFWEGEDDQPVEVVRPYGMIYGHLGRRYSVDLIQMSP